MKMTNVTNHGLAASSLAAGRPRAARRALLFCLLAALALVPTLAQDKGASTASDDELFGEEQVTEAAAPTQAPVNKFLKYDQVKIGGLITGTLGAAVNYLDPWSGSQDFFAPDATTLDPALSGRLTLVAKPVEDFGVNGEIRFAYPFATTQTFMTSATKTASVTVPNITIWSFYSKWSYKDSLFMSFGKQPIAWGVSKGFFQPADDIFALSSVDFTDLSAEREGPLSFKAMYSVPLTMTNFYLIAGLPALTGGATEYKFEDLRFAAKAEFNFGNTEVAAAGFYGYNDHPRALIMATTGTGDFNFYGEAIAKYGSERYFVDKGGSTNVLLWTAAQKADQFWLSGTLGGYYTDSNNNLTIMAQLYYNGEAQASDLSAKDAYSWYLLHPTEADRMRLSPFYAGVSLSKTKLFNDYLSTGLYVVASLSDGSGMVVPSVSYALTDYWSVKLSGSFTFGSAGGEFIINGADMGYIAAHSSFSGGLPVIAFADKPGASVSLTFSLGSGGF
jgi:hypothetical protein